MDNDDRFNPMTANDLDDDEADYTNDRGFAEILVPTQTKNGRIKKVLTKVFTSSGTGTRIRDAETGFYYNSRIGSKMEDAYFKVSYSRGILKSPNNSHTLFYENPRAFMRHLNEYVDEDIINKWEAKVQAWQNSVQDELPQTTTIVR